MAVLLDGKILSNKILETLEINIKRQAKKPILAVILVGEDPASQIYVRNKQKTAQKIGIESLVIELPADVSEENLIEHIHILNEDKNINAILVQLPLPKHINSNRVIEKIDPLKDVDGFHPINAGKLAIGQMPYSYPCTPKGIMKLLDSYNIKLEGLNAVVVGRSNIVGKPLAQMLLNNNTTVTIAHSKTKNLPDITKNADIVFTAIGKSNFLTAEMVKENAIIVDVGINRINNKLTGDVDFKSVEPKASFITPVPGGVGPMTIAMLMENTFELYKLQNQTKY